jgi:uncharacterized protein (TIRG00374 family)
MSEDAKRRRRNLIRSVIVAVILGVGIYGVLAVAADVRRVGHALEAFEWWTFAAALALAFGNYVLRFTKWHYYVRCLDIRLPVVESFAIFLAGFVMAVTPGKFGEVLKSVLLKERLDVPIARSAPIVLAERLTDLIAILLLCVAGAVTFRYGWIFMLVVSVLTLVLVLSVTIRPFGEVILSVLSRLPLIRRWDSKFREAYESTALMARWDRLLGPILVSVAAWFCECVAFWLVVRGFGAEGLDLYTATFIYAFSTAAGALAMMPGGLGVTEGGLTGLLIKIGPAAIDKGAAVGATIITRLATLWFAVAVGIIALMIYTKVWLRSSVREA